MTKEHKMISDLFRICGYATGMLEGIIYYIDDQKARDIITNTIHEINTQLDEIMLQYMPIPESKL